MNREWFHSPLPMNIVYWTFIGLMAIYISPMVLAILVLLPGFSSSPEVEVERNGQTVRVRGSGEMSERQLRAAVKEAMDA